VIDEKEEVKSLSAGGRFLAVIRPGVSVRVVNLATGRALPNTIPLSERVFRTLSPDGRFVVTTNRDGNKVVHVCDVETGRLAIKAIELSDVVTGVDFSPDLQILRIACQDGKLSEWTLSTGENNWQTTVPVGFGLTWTSDGKKVYSGDGIWDTQTGQRLAPPINTPFSFSPDLFGRAHDHFSLNGDVLLTVRRSLFGRESMMRLWDSQTAQPLSPWIGIDPDFLAASLSPGGNHVRTVYKDGIRTWDIGPDSRPTVDLLRFVQLHYGHRLDKEGALAPLSRDDRVTTWQVLRLKYPDEFTVPAAAARAWRERQVSECMRKGNTQGAQFHRNWLNSETAPRKQGKE